ncbi:MAG: single-stranded DNA-binding protein [Sporichthyaceae bacterium]|nr:single-stranded DNA-binding protein [Sporichthyaceae bacterium]
MKETTITVVGNVAKEPSLRVTANGTRLVSFRLASTERRYDRSLNGWRDGDTVFWSVTCWRNTGDNVLDSIKMGEPVFVHGRLRIRGFDNKEGVRITTNEVEAYAVGHDLTWGVSRFTKASVVAGQHDFEPEDDDNEEQASTLVRQETGAVGDPRDLSPTAA